MTESLNDQFASLSVKAKNLSAGPRAKMSSSRPPSLSAATDASSSTGSEEGTDPSEPFDIISVNEGRFESPPSSSPEGTPPSSITALEEVSPLSAPPELFDNNDPADPSGAPSADNRGTSIGILFKARGNAKQELQIYFDKHKDPFEQGPLPKRAFVTWGDANEGHIERFTCIFVSPIGELFPSGELWDAQGHSHRYESVSKTHWYKTKKKAIEAAAARAIDCLNYRSFPLATGDDRFQFGKEGPYDTSDDPESPPRDLPSNIPEQTKQEIRSMRGII